MTIGLIAVALLVFRGGWAAGEEGGDFAARARRLRESFPGLFLPDAAIALAADVGKPTVFGEPDPPEGFAGPDSTGKHPFGIYVPPGGEDYFKGDISIEQWIFHEMFHLHNRRTREYDTFIARAFPDESDPLVRWIARDPYHRTFSREEAFINLVTFADPPRTEEQQRAMRDWFDAIGAKGMSFPEIKKILRVIEH